MTSLPSRTRSLRKPGESSKKHSSSESTAPILEPPEATRSQSPSRLPVKPSSRPPSSASSTVRPPSQAKISRSLSQKSRTSKEPDQLLKKDRSRPPITTSKHLRHGSSTTLPPPPPQRTSGHSRTQSSSTLTASASRAPSRGEDAPRPPTAGEAPRKPFTTLQQHFSPAKSRGPKPHPAVFLAAPSPSKLPANIAISAETAALQNELLQLHLLHKAAPLVDKEWRASAERSLRAKFHAAVDRHDALAHMEAEERQKVNAVALKSWQDTGTPGWGLEEKIQVLDEVTIGLWNLEEPGGKYARAVSRFERWLKQCQDILERRDKGMVEDSELDFISEMDTSWKDDSEAIVRKLETWKEMLKGLGMPEVGSSLFTVVEGFRSLVRGMLMELQVMAKIEQDALRAELEWVRSMIEESSDDEAMTAGAIWRVM